MIEWVSLIILVVIFFIIFKIVKKILFTILIFFLIIILFTSGMAYYVYEDAKNLKEIFSDEPKYMILEENNEVYSIIEFNKIGENESINVVENLDKDYNEIYVNIDVIEEGYKDDEKVKKKDLLQILRGNITIPPNINEREFRGMMFMHGFANAMENGGKDFMLNKFREGEIRIEPEPFVLRLIKRIPSF